MSGSHFVSNAILWATAIVASAMAHAPVFLTTVLLPALAAGALVLTWPRSRTSTCQA